MEGNNQIKKSIEEKYLEWYQDNFSSMKKFWIDNFVFPMVFPSISVGILKYVLNWSLSKEMWFFVFLMLYSVTLAERILSRIEQLIKVLDKIIG